MTFPPPSAPFPVATVSALAVALAVVACGKSEERMLPRYGDV